MLKGNTFIPCLRATRKNRMACRLKRECMSALVSTANLLCMHTVMRGQYASSKKERSAVLHACHEEECRQQEWREGSY